MNKYTRFFTFFTIFTILDQVSKIWIESYFKCPATPVAPATCQKTAMGTLFPKGCVEQIPIVDGVFALSHTHNQGAAFGIMQGQMFIFAIFTIIAVFFIGFTLKEMHEDDKFQNIALALIGSGAIGNAIDRGRLGYVVDFLRVYSEKGSELFVWLQTNVGMTEWPSFNIADAAIVVGFGMFLIHGMFLEKDDEGDDEDIAPAEVKEELV